jgi:hypothetical protein
VPAQARPGVPLRRPARRRHGASPSAAASLPSLPLSSPLSALSSLPPSALPSPLSTPLPSALPSPSSSDAQQQRRGRIALLYTTRAGHTIAGGLHHGATIREGYTIRATPCRAHEGVRFSLTAPPPPRRPPPPSCGRRPSRPCPRKVAARPLCQSEKDAKSAQKLGQLQPFIDVFSQECMGQLASFGPT